MSKENYFKMLSQIDVSEHVEKKGRFSYLSWAWAVQQLREVDPTAVWEVKRFGEEQVPFQKTELGYFVEVAVTVQGITLSQIHPVLDNYNKPIKTPNTFQINTSIQRALVKAIALHGLGLYIYAGEDLPPESAEDKAKRESAEETERLELIANIKEICEGNMEASATVTDAEEKSGKSLDEMPVNFLVRLTELLGTKLK